jgi:predicted O-methyltransferase YrrM
MDEQMLTATQASDVGVADAAAAETLAAEPERLGETRLLDVIPDYDKVDGWLKLAEAEALFRHAAAVSAGCIVEVGSFRGRSTVALCAGSSAGAKVPVYAVEPHEHFTGTKGGVYGPGDRKAFFRTMLATKMTAVVRLLNTSSELVTANWNQKVSLLFIDGDRREESVRRDFLSWAPHLADQAVVIFRDAQEQGPAKVIAAHITMGVLAPEAVFGSLRSFQFNAAALPHNAPAAPTAALASVDPALIIKPEIVQPGLTMETVAYYVYYGNGGAYLYQSIPKCACTTIKTILLEFEGLPVDENEWKRHDKTKNRFPGLGHLSLAQQEDVYQGRTDTFKFVIVRDPYTRMASAYLDKIKMVGKKRAPYWTDLIRDAAAEQEVAVSDEITFEEFVRVVSAQKVESMDSHWRPQYFEGRFGYIKYDYIGHLEMLPLDLTYILERIGAPAHLKQMAMKPQNVTGAQIDLWDEVSPEVRSAYLKTFAIDFETLRYPMRWPGHGG